MSPEPTIIPGVLYRHGDTTDTDPFTTPDGMGYPLYRFICQRRMDRRERTVDFCHWETLDDPRQGARDRGPRWLSGAAPLSHLIGASACTLVPYRVPTLVGPFAHGIPYGSRLVWPASDDAPLMGEPLMMGVVLIDWAVQAIDDMGPMLEGLTTVGEDGDVYVVDATSHIDQMILLPPRT